MLGKFFLLGSGAKMDPEISSQIAKNGIKKLPIYFFDFYNLWALFWVDFGSYFGAKQSHDAPRWTQEGPQEPQITEKQQLQKV